VSEEWTSIAREFWERAGVAHQIDLRTGPALETLAKMADDEPFDLAFVDADKERYGDYYDVLIERLRPGGVLLADNTLQGGRILDANSDRSGTRAMRAFNDRVAADERVTTVLLPIGDGVTVAQRR
jgi:caffeoyl-CoA O-methyltransferase